MATLLELAHTHTTLSRRELAHLQRLTTSWGILADLCFSDLLLIAPIAEEDGHRFVVLGQVRPTTDQTLYPVDMVGTVVDEVARPLVTRAWRMGEVIEGDAAVLGSTERVRLQCIPVRSRGNVIALVTRETATAFGRRRGELERYYLEAFDRFANMIAEGSFPFPREEVEPEDAPRVPDGVILLDRDRKIQFVSPNAVSSLHRMGIHAYTSGIHLAEVGFDETAAESAFRLRLPITEELERGDTSMLEHVIPLLKTGSAVGALILLRDITDLRRRDRLLLSKDATIREIHHRVKNNLQTIAALLRLQGRRLESGEAQQAIEESERRIRSIAIVHETLSREAAEVVPFDEIVRPLVRVAEESVSSDDVHIRFEVEGDVGDLPGEVATPLAVVLNELMQNAVDHAFPRDGGPVDGRVHLQLARQDGNVVIDVVDDGVGLPEGFTLEHSKGLGLSIVQALVTGELAGKIDMQEQGGTAVHLEVPLAAPRVELA